jgi:hypothetical protein
VFALARMAEIRIQNLKESNARSYYRLMKKARRKQEESKKKAMQDADSLSMRLLGINANDNTRYALS